MNVYNYGNYGIPSYYLRHTNFIEKEISELHYVRSPALTTTVEFLWFKFQALQIACKNKMKSLGPKSSWIPSFFRLSTGHFKNLPLYDPGKNESKVDQNKPLYFLFG